MGSEGKSEQAAKLKTRRPRCEGSDYRSTAHFKGTNRTHTGALTWSFNPVGIS
jgi:hypothetical protein